MFSDLGPEEKKQLIEIFSLLVPAAFYVLGMIEGRSGRRFFLAGMALHGAAILYRAFSVQGIPLFEKHDNVSFFAFSTAAVAWYFLGRKGLQAFSLVAVPLTSIILLAAVLFPTINTVSPFIRTFWFVLHMFFLFTSYGFFGVSACAGAAYLKSRDYDLEALQYRLAAVGWTIYTISLVAGSIWFFIAYGTYWLWTSRELWTTLTWFLFGMYLHQRLIGRLSGRPAAIAGILAFAAALFSYFGVGTVIPAPPVQF